MYASQNASTAFEPEPEVGDGDGTDDPAEDQRGDPVAEAQPLRDEMRFLSLT
jgi:hypothetical protein